MSKTYDYLKQAGVFYIASVDANGQPRVRPFGAVAEFEGKLYITTNNQKEVYKQLIANPKTEMSAMVGGTWIRVTGTVKEDARREARAAMLAENEGLRRMYSEDDGIMTVFYFEPGTAATVCSFTEAPQTEVL